MKSPVHPQPGAPAPDPFGFAAPGAAADPFATPEAPLPPGAPAPPPLRVDDLVSGSLRLAAADLRTLTAITAICALGPAIVEFVGALFAGDDGRHPLGSIANIIRLITLAIAQGGMVHVLLTRAAGRPVPGVQEGLVVGNQHIGRIVAISLLTGLACLGVAFPGIIVTALLIPESTILAVLVGLIAVGLPVLFVYARFLLAVPVAVQGGLPGSKAITRSRTLTKGHTMALAGSAMVLFLLLLVFAFGALGLPAFLGALAFGGEDGEMPIPFVVAEHVLGFGFEVLWTVSLTALATQAFIRRVGVGGAATEDLAEIFR
ncbi:MAG: hypothetical protein AAGH15_03770 [Myxococcota bacterium]